MSESEKPKYFWEGRVIRLTRDDYNQWLRAYPHLELDGALQAKDDELWQIGTDDEKAKWFWATSMWLMAMNQTQARLKAESKQTWKERRDPNRNDPFAAQYAKERR